MNSAVGHSPLPPAIRRAHIALIGTGLMMSIALIAWAAFSYFSRGEQSALSTLAMGATASIAMTVYLRWFLRKSSRS